MNGIIIQRNLRCGNVRIVLRLCYQFKSEPWRGLVTGYGNFFIISVGCPYQSPIGIFRWQRLTLFKRRLINKQINGIEINAYFVKFDHLERYYLLCIDSLCPYKLRKDYPKEE